MFKGHDLNDRPGSFFFVLSTSSPISKRLGLSGAKAQNRDWLPETWQSFFIKRNSGCETLRILEMNH